MRIRLETPEAFFAPRGAATVLSRGGCWATKGSFMTDDDDTARPLRPGDG